MVGGSSSASAGRRCCRPHRTAHTTPVTYYRLLLLSLFVLRAFFFCVRCRERDVKKERKKNQVAKNQLEKRIFFSSVFVWNSKDPQKKVSQKDFFFFPLFVQPGVSFASQRLINRCRCYFFCVCVCGYSYVSICQTTSDRFLKGKKKKKVHSFILQTSAGIGYDNTFYTVF